MRYPDGFRQIAGRFRLDDKIGFSLLRSEKHAPARAGRYCDSYETVTIAVAELFPV